MTNKLIEQINALFNKQKTVGLTDEEKREQLRLRKIYIEGIRDQVKNQLSQIRFKD